MNYRDPDTMNDVSEIKQRITDLHRVARLTEWRSEAYRSKVEIINLKARLKTIKAEAAA